MVTLINYSAISPLPDVMKEGNRGYLYRIDRWKPNIYTSGGYPCALVVLGSWSDVNDLILVHLDLYINWEEVLLADA